MVAAQIYIPTSIVEGPPLLHILTSTLASGLLDSSHFHRCEVRPHCGFDLPFP